MSPEDAITRAHEEAMQRGEGFYRDPVSGLSVMTAKRHLARGYCCGSGCRHCPYPADEQARAGRPTTR